MNLNNTKTFRSIADRLQSELKLKLVLLVGLNLVVYVPYYFFQRHHFFPTTSMLFGFFDLVIPFSSNAIWLYLSIYLLIPIGPFLMNRRKQIFRYAAGIIFISLLADVIFLFRPTVCPRPVIARTSIAYQIFTKIDNDYHAFPSLHAAFAVYSALCGGLVLRELGSRNFWRIGLWLWAFLILYATLATKQHVIADIIAGSALGVGAFACVFREWAFLSKDKLPSSSVDINLTKPRSNSL